MTKQRTAILTALKRSPGHYTADVIYEMAKAYYPTMSRATVYNNLGALSQQGLIRRLHIDGLADRYDRTVSPHEHFICNECGEITDFCFEKFTEELERRIGECVTSYELNIRGVCAACHRS